jgi:hypothetical protein
MGAMGAVLWLTRHFHSAILFAADQTSVEKPSLGRFFS